VPLVSLWSMREAVSGIEGLGQAQYVFVELPTVSGGRAPPTAAETWVWLFRDAALLDAMPKGLSEAQEGALHLAEEATFSLEEAEAYRRVNDEIAQAEQLGIEREARGEACSSCRRSPTSRSSQARSGKSSRPSVAPTSWSCSGRAPPSS